MNVDTVLRERAEQNQQTIKAKRESVYWWRRLGEKERTWKRFPIKLHCVVCGKRMQSMRPTKQTCSNACRLRLSRWRRMPKTVKRKRKAKLAKQWRRAQWTKRKRSLELEKEWKGWRTQHPPRPLAEIEAEIHALLGRLRRPTGFISNNA